MVLNEPPPRSIAVFRALQLGDLLCAVPALKALRLACPGARIVLIGLPWAREFARRYRDLVDGFLEFPGWPGLPEREAEVRALPSFMAAAQAEDFDLAIQLHGSGSYVNSICELLGAKRSAGFYVPGEFCPDARSFMAYPATGSEARRLQLLMEFLGAPILPPKLSFPVLPEDEAEWRRLRAERGMGEGGYACVHPGARWASRRWLPERFAAVADWLSDRGLDIVLTGSDGERGLTAEVARLMKGPSLDAAGMTSLGGLAAALSRARLLVCNDTGVSHLAAALGTRSVVVASGSDVRRWAPEDPLRHRVLSVDIDCRPCGFETCPIGHPCASEVTVEQVLREARSQAADL